MSGFCCGVEQSPLCPSIAAPATIWSVWERLQPYFCRVSLLFPYRDLQCCAKREELSDTWSSFEGRLSRDAWPVGPNRTFASVSSARFCLRWLLGGKLRLFTFKCRLAEWFKLTLACALDLAALENIPSLSFRIVYQAGVVQLCGVLNPPPLCWRWTQVDCLPRILWDVNDCSAHPPSALRQASATLWFRFSGF